jgi:hypothetical protein
MNAEEITEALEARGHVVEELRDTNLCIKGAAAMTLSHEFVHTDRYFYSDALNEFLTFIEDNGWRHDAGFLPIEWGFVITKRDS